MPNIGAQERKNSLYPEVGEILRDARTHGIPILFIASWRPIPMIHFALRLPVLFLLVIPMMACTSGTTPETEELSAQEILAHMAAQYAAAQTYRDEGTLTTTISSPDQIFSTNQQFNTAFERPDKFRFEYLDLPGQTVRETRIGYIVWRSGDQLGSYFWARPEQRALSSLAEGLAGATGVSGGSAARVPQLLMPELLRGRGTALHANLANPVRQPDSPVKNQEAFVVSGNTGRFDVRFWIRKSDYMILKVEQFLKQENDFESLTVTHYSPTLDAEIPPTLLEFRAPPNRDAQSGR